MPHKRLSQPFLAFDLDLQKRAAAAAATGSSPAAGTPANAATSGAGATVGRAQDAGCTQLTPFGDNKHRIAADWEHDETLHIKVKADGRWNAVAFWFELDMGCGSTSRIASWQAGGSAGGSAAAVGTSWQQSVQYLDGMTVQQVRLVPSVVFSVSISPLLIRRACSTSSVRRTLMRHLGDVLSAFGA